MAGKLLTTNLLAIIALLSNSGNSNLVQAEFASAGQGVVRIDLEKRYLQHFDNVQLNEQVDLNLMIDSQDKTVDDPLLQNEMSYS